MATRRSGAVVDDTLRGGDDGKEGAGEGGALSSLTCGAVVGVGGVDHCDRSAHDIAIRTNVSLGLDIIGTICVVFDD